MAINRATKPITLSTPKTTPEITESAAIVKTSTTAPSPRAGTTKPSKYPGRTEKSRATKTSKSPMTKSYTEGTTSKTSLPTRTAPSSSKTLTYTPYSVNTSPSYKTKTTTPPPPPPPPPKTIPPPIPPPSDSKQIITQKKLKDKEIDKKKYGSKGEIAWRQGIYWITLWPRIGGGYIRTYTKEPPEGYKRRKRLPNETFFTRGDRNKIPAEIKMDMGIVDVKITPTGEVKLKYKRKK